MILETGGQGVRFKPRLVQGVPSNGTEPTMLILDGQQRLTSLYLALQSNLPVKTRNDKGGEIDRVYYLDIASCLDSEVDREDAVVSLPPNRIRRKNFNRDIELDASTSAKEYEIGLFPLSVIFNNSYYDWCQGYRAHFSYDVEKLKRLDAFESDVVQRFRLYRVPTIELTRDTNKEAVCQVFEKVYTGGVALTVFDLMTATFAADDFDLRKDWEDRKERLSGKEVLNSVGSTDFLQVVTLLTSYEKSLSEGSGVSCKRRDVLNLTLKDFLTNADRAELGFFAAAKLLVREKVFDGWNLPYGTQLVPLSAICAFLGNKFETDEVKQKLARWYWCGVFGELYGGANESRFANDIVEVLSWISGDSVPRTISDSNFAHTRLLTLQTRQSAAYKGVIALLIQQGSNDFINGDSIELTTYFEQAVDIHHIFPRSYCEKEGHPRQKWNSVINKTPITSHSNRVLGGHAPDQYLRSIEKNHGVETTRLNELLATNLIEAELLRAKDFDAFIRDRASRLLDLLEKATGKVIVGRDADETIEAFGAPTLSTSVGIPMSGN